MDEHGVVAAIAEQRTTDLADPAACLYPARSGRVELTKLLKLSILVYCEEGSAHGAGHLLGIALRLILLARTPRALGDRNKGSDILSGGIINVVQR